MSSWHGIGAIKSLYYFLHYITTPIAKFKAADMRLTDLSYTLSILPVMILSYYVPYLVSYLAPKPTTRHAAMWLWYPFPLWVSLGQWLLRRTIMPNTVRHDRIHGVTRDIWPIRITVGMLAILSGAIWLYTLISAPFSLTALFLPSREGLQSFAGSIQELLKWDHLYFAGSSLLWIVYVFWDLKKAGMVQQSWAVILSGLAAVTMLFGPGAATAAGWLWREEVLATRRHKGAVVNGWEGKKG